ncbi:MAG: ATP-binding protein [Candidatus Promineifilaceae bacterium]
MATCHRIIAQHGGEISVASVPGEGTTFVVLLPVSQTPQDGPNLQHEV